MKLNTYLNIILGFSLTQALSVLLILTQVPLLPIEDQNTGDRIKTVFFMFFFSFSGAIIDTVYLFLSSHHLRLGLPEPIRMLNNHQSYLFLLSFLTLISVTLCFLTRFSTITLPIITLTLITLRFLLP